MYEQESGWFIEKEKGCDLDWLKEHPGLFNLENVDFDRENIRSLIDNGYVLIGVIPNPITSKAQHAVTIVGYNVQSKYNHLTYMDSDIDLVFGGYSWKYDTRFMHFFKSKTKIKR